MQRKDRITHVLQIMLRTLGIESVVIMTILLVISVLIGEEVLPMLEERFYSGSALLIGAIGGSCLLARAYNGKKALAALIHTVFLTMILCIFVLAGEGSGHGISILFRLLVELTGSIIGCILAVSLPKRRNRK